jgi:hypothetical protein
MDKLAQYKEIVHQVFHQFVDERSQKKEDIAIQFLADTLNDHYQVLRMGWHNGQQVFNVIFHIDIIDSKIWVQRNMSDYDIVGDIENQGVPKSDIVLAFHAPTMRPHTGYAFA